MLYKKMKISYKKGSYVRMNIFLMTFSLRPSSSYPNFLAIV